MKLTVIAALVAGAVFTAATRLGPTAPGQPAVPVAVVVTTYNAAGARLIQTIHERNAITRLANDVDRLLPARNPSFGCPPDNGSRYEAVFSYRNGGRTTLIARQTGCEQVVIAGEYWGSGAWSNPRLLEDLDALFPPSWQTHF